MENVKSTTVSEATEFFKSELSALMKKQGLEANDAAVNYIADLLTRNISSEVFFQKDAEGNLKENILADLYMEYLQGDADIKKSALRRLGDICMIVTGFFSPRLQRKTVDLDYYFGMGGGAYAQLATLPNASTRATTYKELSVKFKPFSDVLGEMSERSGIQNNTDLLRTYERWLSTGNERLRTLLSSHGIHPLAVNLKDKQ